MKTRALLLLTGGLVTLPLLLNLTGCGKSDRESAPPAPATPVTKAAKPEVPVSDLDLSQTAPLAPAGPMSEADKAWNEVLTSLQPPEFPAEWNLQPPTEAQRKAFAQTNAVLAAAAADRVRDFYTRYPENGHLAEARERERYLLGVASELGHTNAMARLAALNEARLKDPNLPEEERLAMRLEQIQRIVNSESETNLNARVDELEKAVRALRKEFTNNAEVVGLLLAVAQARLSQGDTDKARALTVEVADAVNDPDIQEAAQGLLKSIQRVGQPLAVRFKAIDGRDVDVQAMAGKVVLVDFWATWCGPCMAELPKVKATYESLHPKGFEIVGISLDQDRKALERVVAKEKIPWPQHMEMAPGATNYSDAFGIESIPTMWLVDKKGRLRDVNAREGLAAKVEKLLAE